MSARLPETRPPETREAGFSLVEVLLALAILGSVLLSIASLLYIGQRSVLVGRRQTAAISVASDAMEEIRQLGFHQTYSAFGGTGAATGFSTSVLQHTPSGSGIAMVDPWLLRLFDGIGPSSSLQVSIDAVDPANPSGGSPPSLQNAALVRITVEVRWDEPDQPGRTFRLCTVRT